MIDDFSQLNYIGDRSSKAEFFGQKSTKSITVTALSLNEIVDRYCGGEFPDYLSLDIEDYDLDVLKDTNFSKNFPKVISIEDDSDELGEVFRQKGFIPVILIFDAFAVHESLLGNDGSLKLFSI